MITLPELYAFIRAFPAFVGFLKDGYAKFVEMQIHMIDSESQKKIDELNTEITRLKNAKTNSDIATSISTINRR